MKSRRVAVWNTNPSLIEKQVQESEGMTTADSLVYVSITKIRFNDYDRSCLRHLYTEISCQVHVKNLMEMMLRGEPLPPAEGYVMEDKPGYYRISDGNHRLIAAELAGVKRIPLLVENSTEQDFIPEVPKIEDMGF